MFKKMILLTIIFTCLCLCGCVNKVIPSNKGVTSIEVYKWDEPTLVTVIEDKELIDKLVKELNRAKKYSTALIDMAMPEYRLVFKENEQTVFEIGYYTKMRKYDNKELRYWKFDEYYGATLELPLE